MSKVTELFGADNRFGREEFTLLAASADILDGLGVLDFGQSLELRLALRDGSEVSVSLEAEQQAKPNMEWRFWGEIWGPMDGDSVTGFDGLSTESVYGTEKNHGMPLHLRARIPYRYEHVPEQSLLYFQIRFMTGNSSRAEKSLLGTWREALSLAKAKPAQARRLVLDLRFNIGGDGSLSVPLVNELIRHYPFAQEPGHLFVLTSGATFSAGVMLVEELNDHLPLVLLGEPMGAAFNHYGDAESVRLPLSGFGLTVSRRRWQLSRSDDERRFLPVQYPAAFTGQDYFGRRDPAIELITGSPIPFPTLDRVLAEQGGSKLREVLAEAQRRWGHLDYWSPVGRMVFDDLADELVDSGRLEDARVALEINTELFPDEWDTWDDLGQVCFEMRQRSCVLRAYSRALELSPSNWRAEQQRAIIAKLEDNGEGAAQ